MRLKARAYDAKILDTSLKQVVEAITRRGGTVVGPIPLPTEIRKYTVNRSPFVHKKSREQFEMRVHKRLLDVLNPDQKVMESLADLNLPAGVDVEIKMA